MLVVIRKRDAERRQARFHLVGLQRALGLTAAQERFDAYVDLVREHGRIGSPGPVRIDRFPDEASAVAAAVDYLRRKRRKGYQ